ncbi:hypothetical protein JHK82_014153 [Glycine max]|nr:hypothetical protein JHK85_014527 [Glycine max]KAG5147272.1 hypothetical protein JHK82_014153 [Glycine max]
MRGVKRAMFVGRALRSNSNSGVSPHGHGCLTPSNPNPNPNPSVSVTGFRYLSAYAAATSLVQDALTKAFKPKELASFNTRPVHSATRLQLNNFRSFSIHSNISLMIKSFNLLQRFWTIMIFHSKWLRPIHHLKSGRDIIEHALIGKWFSEMDLAVGQSSRVSEHS